MSKITLQQLQSDFAGDGWPIILSLDSEEHQYSLQLDIRSDIKWFEGHFPGQPVLAGVVQTHWAGELSKCFFPIGEDFQRIDNLKFQSVILPDIKLELRLVYLANKNAVKFSYSDSEHNYSTGTLIFG
ncbi:hypothetical protein OAG89_03785 [Pseudomonadales bacterium]|nr:hypothetical protein [Pseudomonadales bacterium]